MPFRRPQTYARKDLLTPGGYNQLGRNARLLDQALRVEHTAAGEHNSPTIARTVGTVLASPVPSYSLIGFDGDVSLGAGHNPAVGKVVLTLPRERFGVELPVVVQNASVTGADLPCLTTAFWVVRLQSVIEALLVDKEIEVYSCFWDGVLDTPGSGAWTAVAYGGGEDATFHLAAHGLSLGVGSVRTFGQPLLARQGNRAGGGSTYTNQLIQGGADLEAAFRTEHTGGAHDLRSIPKCWAHVQWNGSRYVILDQEASPNWSGGSISSVELVSAGVADVVFTRSMNHTFWQMFIDVDYPRLYGSTADYFIACCPEQYQLGNVGTVFFYKKLLSSPAGEEYWTRDGGCDFHVWIYEDHGAS